MFRDTRLPDRFWSKVEPTETCWPWTAALTHGYGYFFWDGRAQNAHRVVYAELMSPIPDGFDVDHLCHNADPSCPGGDTCLHRRCVRPDHLEAVPPGTNKERGKSIPASRARQTHCKRDHELSGHNLMVNKRGHRECRICKYETNRQWRKINKPWLNRTK